MTCETPISPGAGAPAWPRIRTLGVDGVLISFGDRLEEPANRAALALRDAIERAGWDGIEETTSSLVSTYLRFDPLHCDAATVTARLESLLATRDWSTAPLPRGRRLWRLPTVFGTDLAPQLAEAATMAGLTPEAAIAQIAATRLTVRTIGFAPGQPYLGDLPPAWDIPRQTGLTPRVPEGAVTVAIRQIVLFAISAPTGWRHVGQTAFRLFRPEAPEPFALRPGDEVIFDPVAPDKLERMRGDGPDGGASFETLP
ncbi:MAG: 5-oxoprolinase subunit PxpB [Pararhodobacter sp.]